MRTLVVLPGLLLMAVPAVAIENLQVSVTPPTLTSIPAVIDYSVTENDPAASIVNLRWDFGDGGRSLEASGRYTYVSPGTYIISLSIEDSNGTITDATTQVVVSDPTFPTLTVDAPAMDPTIVSTSSLTVTGRAESAQEVRWSTDRGESGVTAGTSTFTAVVPLLPGRNRLMINAYGPSGSMTRRERVIYFHPPEPLAITGVQPAAGPVERWAPFVVRFEIANTRATTLDWPYEANPPRGVPAGLGITVNGEFSDDGFFTRLIQPAYFYQPYTREIREQQDYLRQSATGYWLCRFAPPRDGQWQFQLRATDGGGTTLTPPASFTVVPPANPDNHGFVRINVKDTRYFQFDDGTHFLGTGHNENYTDVRYFTVGMDSRLAQMGHDSVQLLRIWMSTSNIFGSAWPPLLSATLPYVGYLPAEGLSPAQAYGDGLVSIRLNQANPTMFYGWQGGDIPVTPGKSYRLCVRAKAIGVTGPNRADKPYGFTIKRTGWPDPPDYFPNATPIIPHVTGSRDWSLLQGQFTVGANTNYLRYLSCTLENSTGGEAYVDEISIREILPDGKLGPEVNRRPKMNYHTCFDQSASYQYDYLLEKATQQGLYLRIVVTEKNDYLLERLGKGGFMVKTRSPANFNARPGTAGYAYQTYWWRYLTARWGADRAVHSWELANEQDPFDSRGYVHAQNMAAWFLSNDPQQHSVTTSFWHSFPATEFWKNPAYPNVNHADLHAYIPYDTPENSDTALAHWTWGRQAAGNQLSKPIIRGETGLFGPPGTNADHPDLKKDLDGVWLHNFTWAQLDANGMYELYWFADSIRASGQTPSRYPVYRAYRRFMSDIPLGNGRYADARATSSNPQVRAVGQADRVQHRGHLWISHALHTWRNVVDQAPITPANAAISVPQLTPKRDYRLTWFDTRTGLAIREETQTTNDSGELVLPVQALVSDTAVKWSMIPHAPGDLDGDRDVDQEDFGRLQRCYSGPGLPQADAACAVARLDGDDDVDQEDFSILRDCMSGAGIPADLNCGR